MKKIFSFALLAAALASCSSEETTNTSTSGFKLKRHDPPLSEAFRKIELGTTKHLTDISFADERNGAVCGSDGTVMKTTDAGATWTALNGPRDLSLTSVFMYDPTTLFAARRDIYKMDPRGMADMNLLSQLNGSQTRNIYFSNPSTGVLIKGGNIMRTTNGGTSWSVVHSQDYIQRMQFASANVAYAYGGTTVHGASGGVLAKSFDGGQTWSSIIIDSKEIVAAYFNSEAMGFKVDFENTVARTTDGGETWTDIGVIPASRLGGQVSSIIYVTDSQMFATTFQGEIYRSSDAGNSWEVIYEAQTPLSRIYKINRTLYAVGNNGTLLKN